MQRIALVGSGRLAAALARTLGSSVTLVAGRDASRVMSVAALAGSTRACGIAEIGAAPIDAVWIATSDAAIAPLAASLADSRADWSGVVAVHSAGALDLAPLAPLAGRGARALALHPNASIRGDDPLDRSIVWGVTPPDEASMDLARDLLGADARLVAVDAAARPLYHAAASIAANFSVTLFDLAVRALDAAGIDPATARELVASYMRTSVVRASRDGARAALTGPIERGDDVVVARQREAVERSIPEMVALFDALVAATRALARRDADDSY